MSPQFWGVDPAGPFVGSPVPWEASTPLDPSGAGFSTENATWSSPIETAEIDRTTRDVRIEPLGDRNLGIDHDVPQSP